VDRFTVEHTAAGLKRLIRRLLGGGVTEVGIECGDGPVVDALLAAGLVVLVIAPNQLKTLRSRYGSAGNKDDRFDAVGVQAGWCAVDGKSCRFRVLATGSAGLESWRATRTVHDRRRAAGPCRRDRPRRGLPGRRRGPGRRAQGLRARRLRPDCVRVVEAARRRTGMLWDTTEL